MNIRFNTQLNRLFLHFGPRFAEDGTVGIQSRGYAIAIRKITKNNRFDRHLFAAVGAGVGSEAVFKILRPFISRLAPAVRVQRGAAQLEHFLAPHVNDISVIFVSTVARLEGILGVPGAGLGLVNHIQSAVLANGTCIGVGDIGHVIDAVHGDNIPHVAAAVHQAGNTVAPYIAVKGAQVAQELEGLGIALAHNQRAGILVKHIDQLPRIAIGRIIVVCGGMVVVRQRMDFIAVGFQLGPVVLGLVLLNDGLRIGHSRGGGAGQSRVDGVIAAVVHRYLDFQFDGVKHDGRQVKIADIEAGIITAVSPVHIIRAVMNQRLPNRHNQFCLEDIKNLLGCFIGVSVISAAHREDGVHTQLLRRNGGGGKAVRQTVQHKNGRSPLAPGDLLNLRLEHVVRLALAIGQMVARKRAKHADIAVNGTVQLALHIAGKQLVIVGQIHIHLPRIHNGRNDRGRAGSRGQHAQAHQQRQYQTEPVHLLHNQEAPLKIFKPKNGYNQANLSILKNYNTFVTIWL